MTLTLHGFADQPDQPLHNEILSRNRAMSVYNYLKNILEDELAAPDLVDVSDEDKEKEKAELVGDEYRIEDPSNKQVIIVAHGDSQAKGKGKSQYDSRFRRVDVYVDGDISLLLRRKMDK